MNRIQLTASFFALLILFYGCSKAPEESQKSSPVASEQKQESAAGNTAAKGNTSEKSVLFGESLDVVTECAGFYAAVSEFFFKKKGQEDQVGWAKFAFTVFNKVSSMYVEEIGKDQEIAESKILAGAEKWSLTFAGGGQRTKEQREQEISTHREACEKIMVKNEVIHNIGMEVKKELGF